MKVNEFKIHKNFWKGHVPFEMELPFPRDMAILNSQVCSEKVSLHLLILIDILRLRLI